MYHFRTKHAILGAYIRWSIRQDSPESRKWMSVDLLMNKVTKFNKFKVGVVVLNMVLEGYFEKDNAIGKKEESVRITDKGVIALSGEYFKSQQHQLFWKTFMNVLMTVANIAVAITAMWALTKPNETRLLEDKLFQLQREVKELQATTSPNTPAPKSFDSARSKYSAKQQ